MSSVMKLVIPLVLTAVMSLVPSSASADSATFPDGRDTRGLMDIHRVRVINGERLTTRIVVRDLRRRIRQDGVSVWLDTKAGQRGPEFGIGSGLWMSDWNIGRARGWVHDHVLHCPVSQRLLFKRDTIVFTTGKACLGRYGRVRVSVSTSSGRRNQFQDHSPGKRAFHPWVARH